MRWGLALVPPVTAWPVSLPAWLAKLCSRRARGPGKGIARRSDTGEPGRPASRMRRPAVQPSPARAREYHGEAGERAPGPETSGWPRPGAHRAHKTKTRAAARERQSLEGCTLKLPQRQKQQQEQRQRRGTIRPQGSAPPSPPTPVQAKAKATAKAPGVCHPRTPAKCCRPSSSTAAIVQFHRARQRKVWARVSRRGRAGGLRKTTVQTFPPATSMCRG
jgi:hypothetical protein